MTQQANGGNIPPHQQPLPQYWQGPTADVPPHMRPWRPVTMVSPKSVSGLGGWTARLLMGAAGLQLAGGVLFLLEVDSASLVVQLVSGLLMIACVVLVMVWLNQARSNIEYLDPYRWAGRRRLSKGWAVGAWFVPVGFLWLPLQVVLDVWWGTAEPTREKRRTPKIIVGWWTCWLLAWFTGVRTVNTVSHRNGVRFESASLNVYLGSTALSALFTAAAAVLLCLLVRRVTALQTARLGY
ncbi:hypothetical protein N566_26860 [Streptomycetaceae bacterium MP113-05]|nr:hypothetical protein N566_26860 [Streptomycetaceae bacterium MP113-05]